MRNSPLVLTRSLPPHMTVAEAAKLLHLSTDQVRERIKAGTLDGIRTSQGWMVSQASVTDALRDAD